jgi:hypothetical protein
LSAIYEVTVEVDPGVVQEYLIWLKRHITDIVSEAGFDGAQTFETEAGHAGMRSWVVHYYAADLSVIEHYIRDLAPRFRADAVNRFDGKVQVTRRNLIGVPDLTVSSEKSQIGPHKPKG